MLANVLHSFQHFINKVHISNQINFQICPLTLKQLRVVHDMNQVGSDKVLAKTDLMNQDGSDKALARNELVCVCICDSRLGDRSGWDKFFGNMDKFRRCIFSVFWVGCVCVRVWVCVGVCLCRWVRPGLNFVGY